MYNNSNSDLNKALNLFLYKAAEDYKGMDFYKKLVEFSNDPNAAVSSQSSFLLVGPPTLDGMLTASKSNSKYSFENLFIPLGGIANFNTSEANNLIPMGEIGSSLMRMAPSDTAYNLSLSRLFTSHSNLKYAITKWQFSVATIAGVKTINMARTPGANNSSYFSGLESEVYGIPFGIISVHCDAAGNFVGADFYEQCFMNNFGKGFQSQSVVIIDNASCYVSAIVPLLQGSGDDHISVSKGAIGGTDVKIHSYTYPAINIP